MSRKSGIFNFIKLPNLMVGLVAACACFICGTLFLPNVSFAALGSTYMSGGISTSKKTECKVINGEGSNDNEVLFAKGKSKHFMCGDGDCHHGALVGIIGTGVIKYYDKEYTDAWFECNTGFDDYWEHFGKIDVCTTNNLLFNDRLIVNSGDDTDKVLIDEFNSKILPEGYVVVNDSYVKRYRCLAYQCKDGKIANEDRTRCINECTDDGTEEPADCPSIFTDATTCVKKCVSGEWKTLISGCKDNTYRINKNRNQCIKQYPKNSKSVSTTPPETTMPTASSGDCNSQETCKPSCVSGAESVQFTGGYCMATKCKPNFYKVKNPSGMYQGWCIYKECPAGHHVDTGTDGMVLANDIKCVPNTPTNTGPQVEAPGKTPGKAPGDTDTGPQVKAPDDTDTETPATTETGETTSVPAPEQETPAPTGPADGDDCHDIKANSTTATYMNGECIVHYCMDGYEEKSNDCVKISGPCESLPAHAVRGHREYNADTGDTECIIDDCDDGYVVADDKLSCDEDYEALAEEAREREQSTGNKLIGAVGMGATGIGGSMLMSGLAESAADDEAERAMTAYLETFTCKYGNESVSGGTMNVEIPGGNELINMYSEYVALANDLKLRKAALGMKPGIESEPILDSATTGLYDDVGTGRGKGVYASLARALEDPDGEDAKAWAAQREESEKKTKTGAITAGVGAGVSLIGNIAINGDKDNEDNDDDDEF